MLLHEKTPGKTGKFVVKRKNFPKLKMLSRRENVVFAKIITLSVIVPPCYCRIL